MVATDPSNLYSINQNSGIIFIMIIALQKHQSGILLSVSSTGPMPFKVNTVEK